MIPSGSSGQKKAAALFVFFGLTFAAYVFSGIVTATSVGDWYQTLHKPSFNPPDRLFAPVWSALYLMIASAGWMAWRRAQSHQPRPVVVAFGTQLGLNLLWSVLFFGLQWVSIALIEILLLWASILWAIRVFWRVDRRAALLLVPYAGWVGFAIVLNAAIWKLN